MDLSSEPFEYAVLRDFVIYAYLSQDVAHVPVWDQAVSPSDALTGPRTA